MSQEKTREILMQEICLRISNSLDLQEIFDITCLEIRQFMQADRVAIFEFESESNCTDGEFMSESVVKPFDSVISRRVQDHCFGETYASHYLQGQFWACDNIYDNKKNLPLCHVDILAQFQVKASLVIPLINHDTLWGLLCIHQCAEIRDWQEYDVSLIKHMGNQLTIAIRQATLFQKLQKELEERKRVEKIIQLQAKREKLLRTISQKINQTLDLTEIFAVACDGIKKIIPADRVAIFEFDLEANYDDGIFVSEVVNEEFDSVLATRVQEHTFGESYAELYFQGKYQAIDDIYTSGISPCHLETLEQFQIRANLVIPLSIKNRLWGLVCIHKCSGPYHWAKYEIDLVQQLSNHLAIAIQQAILFEQLQQQLLQREQDQELLTKRNQQLTISNIDLARATRLKDEFLANMSHELRTPLNAILGMTEALKEEVFGKLEKRQMKPLTTIERSGNHLLELINDILDLAKVESGKLELEYNPTNMADLCESSLVFVKQMAYKKRIQLGKKLPLDIPPLELDELRIRQVLINLLTNAVKFTDEGGQITLEVKFDNNHDVSASDNSLSSSYLEFTVIDTGIGIADDQIEQLFQPFVQIDSSLNREYTGTGLGLALVKRITELHGGEVKVASEKGVGSRFRVGLPCQITTELSSDQSKLGNWGRSINRQEEIAAGPLVLLAEDNEDNIDIVESYLKAKGYRIFPVRDGQSAIDQAKLKKPDLILMDIQMPGVDGITAMKEIRKDPDLINIPIIALTALAMKGDRERFLEAGADDYLGKPVRLKELAKVIQQLLVNRIN